MHFKKNQSKSIYKSYYLWIVTGTLVLAGKPTSESVESNDVSESWGYTDIKISKLKFSWTINNYKFCCQEPGKSIRSPVFSSNEGCKWYLNMYLNGEVEDEKDYVALFLISSNCNASTIVKLSFLNASDKLVNSKEFSYKFTPSSSRGYRKFALHTLLSDQEHDFPLEQLTVICEIITTLSSKNSVKQFVVPKRNLVDNFRHLFQNEVLSDVILAAGNRKFKAHKAILAARSPTFKAMFENDTMKSVVEVVDVDSKVLGEMLRYIYTDETSKLENLAPDLLAAAENYGLDRLKTLCEDALREKLSIKNAVHYFILGDKYHAATLKMEAKSFIVAHISDVINTTGFKSLILNQPWLAEEPFTLLG